MLDVVVGPVQPLRADRHRDLHRRAGLARARRAHGRHHRQHAGADLARLPRQVRRPCSCCRRSCCCVVLVCSIGVQLAQGLHRHRARPVPVRALRAPVPGLRADRRARARRAHARQQQVPRPLRRRCSCSWSSRGCPTSASRTGSIATRSRAVAHLFRPERLRATSCRPCSGSGSTGSRSRCCCSCSPTRSGCAAATAAGAAALRAAAARMRRRRVGDRRHRRPRVRRRPAAGSTTTRTSSIRYVTRHDVQRDPGRLREALQGARRRAAAAHHGGRRARRSLSRAAPRAHRRHAHAGQQDRQPITRRLRRLSAPRHARTRSTFGVPAAARRRGARVRWHHYVLDAADGARRRRPSSASTSSTARTASATTAPTRSCSATARFLNAGLTAGDVADPELRLRRGRRALVRQATARNSASRRSRACTTSTTRRTACGARSRATPTSSTTARTFCTAADQLPVTSGYVERDTDRERPPLHRTTAWTRRWPTSTPFVSARYEVRRDVWHGPDGDVAIEIDYQPGHEYNLDRMVAGVKDSLDYFTAHYRAVPAQDRAHHRVPALLAQRRLRRVVSQHGAVQRGDRLHRQGGRRRSARTSTIRTSSPRTRSRTSGGRTRRCRPTCRAPSSSPRAWPSTRR